MARLSRFFLPNQPMHVIHRGKDGKRVFFGKSDYALYRDWLGEAAGKYGCAIHAYVLMPDHVQLLVTPEGPRSLPRLMQSLGRRHSRHVNIGRGLEGARWEGRYRAAPVEANAHLVDCMRFIESVPVQVKMVRRVDGHPWSSYAVHAKGAADPVVKDHRLYTALGATPARRQAVYARLSGTRLPTGFGEKLLAATNGGWAFGSEAFKRRLSQSSGRRVVPLPRGRPRKTPKATPRRRRKR
jgi:putative transposase